MRATPRPCSAGSTASWSRAASGPAAPGACWPRRSTRAARHPLLRDLLRLPVDGDRVRAQRVRAGGRQLHRGRPDAPHKIIYKLQDLLGVEELGGTMRLGAYECALRPGSRAARDLRRHEMSERHRHRYEFNRSTRAASPRAASPSRARRRTEVRGDRGDPRPSLVHRRPVPPRVQVEAPRPHPLFATSCGPAWRTARRGAASPAAAVPWRSSGARGARTRTRSGALSPGGRGPLPDRRPLRHREPAAPALAARLKEITGELGIPFVFKASYDKANRSSLGSYRGPGMERGLEILAGVGARTASPS